MNNEEAYLDMLRRILDEGKYRKPEDEEGRYELFAQLLRFDLSDNKIPLMTTKKVFFKSLAVEMLWFLSGSQDISFLKENNIKIWDLWANEEGVVGPLYGFQWRHWRIDPTVSEKYYNGEKEIDQIMALPETEEKRAAFESLLAGRLSLQTFSMSTVCEKKELEWPTRFVRMNFFNILKTLLMRRKRDPFTYPKNS